MASVTVVGTGYVGLVTALAFVDQGHSVVCVDIDPAKVDSLNAGTPTFFEEGVQDVLARAVENDALRATTDGHDAIRTSDFSFVCVGTPPRGDGSMDDAQVRAAARMVGEGLRHRERPHTVVVKSTVQPGTTESVLLPEIEKALGSPTASLGLCVNPEFLREGSALRDAQNPDRIIIGERNAASGDALMELYEPYACPKLRCTIRTAEMTKYATNAFLATKISFANELANLCNRYGVDWDEVVKGMGLDPRINPRFLVPGVGFGGSCFPKDVAAIVAAGRARGYEASLLWEVLALNDRQPVRAVELLEGELGDLKGKRISVLGLAFKAGTDDVRESRAIPLVQTLLKRGAIVVGYDPVAGPNFAKVIASVPLANTAREALQGCDGCVIQADWPEFRSMEAADFGGMARCVVVDGRRTLDRERLGDRVIYRRIG